MKLIDDSNPPLRLMATPDAIVFDFLRRFLPRRFYHWFLYRMLPQVKLWGDTWIPSIEPYEEFGANQRSCVASVTNIKEGTKSSTTSKELKGDLFQLR